MINSGRVRTIFVALCIVIILGVILAFVGLYLIPHSGNTSTTSSSPSSSSPSYQVQFSTGVSYGPKSGEELDECLPAGAPSSRPGLVMIHGGGWDGGSRAQYDAQCRYFAAEGYDVVTIDYRLDPQYQWPDQIGDAQLAVRYLRANASSLNLDPKHICALGDSSGAQLALLLDVLQTIHPADVASLDANVSPAVQCVIDKFGPGDFTKLYDQNPSVRSYVSAYLDNQVPPAPVYSDASPIDHVTDQAGQAIIFQGTQDQTVLPDQSQELYQAFLKNGVPAQYVSYNGGHEFSGLSQSQIVSYMEQINNYLLTVEPPAGK